MNVVGNKRHLTLVIRLLVDAQGQVQQGVVVDVCGQQVGHFQHVVHVPLIIAGWLAAWAQGHKGERPSQNPS